MKWGLLIWVLICLGIEILLQRSIRQQLFSLSHRLTSDPNSTLGLFGLLMFPGTLLHEGSHIAVASLLGSHVSEVSLLPTYVEDENGEGIVELGSVVAKDVGLIRSSLISIAPTLVGSALILLIGWLVFGFAGVAAAIKGGMWDQAFEYLTRSFSTIWGWIGASVIVIISLNMLPSTADLELGTGLIVLFAVLFGVMAALYFTNSPLLGSTIKAVNLALSWLALVLTFTIVLSVPILFFLRLFTAGG
jgi:hypothetical protein